MKQLERLDELFVGHIGFPGMNYLYNRKHIRRYHKLLQETENYSIEQRNELRLRQFKRLIAYAYEWTPYYKRRFDEVGLKPQDIQSLDDIQHIPILKRDDLVENYRDMIDVRVLDSVAVAERSEEIAGQPIPFAAFRKHKLVRNTSSGSTGQRTVFFEDGSVTGMNWVHELRVKRWFGVPLGANDARLARVSTTYMPASKVARVRKWLWNQLMLPGVNLSDDEYTLILKRIEEFQPKSMWGYTSSLTGLADFIQRTGWDVSGLPLKLLIGWAAPLFEHERRLLQETFGCAASNLYSAREVGHMGARCEYGTMHINDENYILESLPSEKTGSTDDPGLLLATPLFEARMPMIRYSMGDLGRAVPSTCQCGRNLSVIEDLLGRTGEVFYTSEGRMIAPNFWCRFLMTELPGQAVQKFQVVYETTDHVTLKIIKKDHFTEDNENSMRAVIADNFPASTHFDFQYVDDIPRSASGKDVMVVNKTIAGNE